MAEDVESCTVCARVAQAWRRCNTINKLAFFSFASDKQNTLYAQTLLDVRSTVSKNAGGPKAGSNPVGPNGVICDSLHSVLRGVGGRRLHTEAPTNATLVVVGGVTKAL